MTTHPRFLRPSPSNLDLEAYRQTIRRMRALAESHLDALDYCPSTEILLQMERSDEEEWEEDLKEIAVIFDPEHTFTGQAA